MVRYYVKKRKYCKLRKRILKSSLPDQFLINISNRLKCLNRYQKQLIWSGLAFTGISLPISEALSQCQLVKEGTEFRVNTFTTSNQGGPAIASDNEGNFAIVWHSINQPGGSNFDIFCQRYDNNGSPVGIEFMINDSTTGRQFNPAIAMDGMGNFTVAYEWENMDTYDSESIYVKQFDQDGVMISGEFIVNSFHGGNKINPSIAMHSGGDFIIAWTSQGGQDGDQDGIFAQRFNNLGMPVGVEFQVNDFTTGNQRRSAVSMNSDGSFIITWDSNAQDGSGNGVFAKIYDNNGTPLGVEFLVNTHTTNNQAFPSVSNDENGNFIVAWQSFTQDGEGYGIFAQRFNSFGMTIGSEFQVNTITEGNQEKPKISMSNLGQFIVTWESGDGDESGIFARRFDSMGAPLDVSEFLINTWTTNFQRVPAINVHQNGSFVIAWESFDQDMGGGFDNGIYSQRMSSFCIDIGLSDPCNCENENNIVQDGVLLRFHDILTISGTGVPGNDIVLTANNNAGGFTNEMGIGYPIGEILGTVNMDGTIDIAFEFYRVSGQVVDIEIDGAFFMADACDFVICDHPAPIPTLNQWGTIILLLLLSVLAVVGIRLKKLKISITN